MIFKTGTKVLTNVSLSASGRACWVGVGHRRDRVSLVPSSFSLAPGKGGRDGPPSGAVGSPRRNAGAHVGVCQPRGGNELSIHSSMITARGRHLSVLPASTSSLGRALLRSHRIDRPAARNELTPPGLRAVFRRPSETPLDVFSLRRLGGFRVFTGFSVPVRISPSTRERSGQP